MFTFNQNFLLKFSVNYVNLSYWSYICCIVNDVLELFWFLIWIFNQMLRYCIYLYCCMILLFCEFVTLSWLLLLCLHDGMCALSFTDFIILTKVILRAWFIIWFWWLYRVAPDVEINICYTFHLLWLILTHVTKYKVLILYLLHLQWSQFSEVCLDS